jgi:putative oxidoreductase
MTYLSNLNNYRNTGLLILRVGLGAMMIYHGYPKLMGGTHSWVGLGASTKYVGINFWPVMWGLGAALAETLGGFLIIIGLAFRPAAFFLLISLIVAAASHLGQGDGLDGAAHAIELAFVFAGLIFIGPGKYSVDKNRLTFFVKEEY